MVNTKRYTKKAKTANKAMRIEVFDMTKKSSANNMEMSRKFHQWGW